MSETPNSGRKTIWTLTYRARDNYEAYAGSTLSAVLREARSIMLNAIAQNRSNYGDEEFDSIEALLNEEGLTLARIIAAMELWESATCGDEWFGHGFDGLLEDPLGEEIPAGEVLSEAEILGLPRMGSMEYYESIAPAVPEHTLGQE